MMSKFSILLFFVLGFISHGFSINIQKIDWKNHGYKEEKRYCYKHIDDDYVIFIHKTGNYVAIVPLKDTSKEKIKGFSFSLNKWRYGILHGDKGLIYQLKKKYNDHALCRYGCDTSYRTKNKQNFYAAIEFCLETNDISLEVIKELVSIGVFRKISFD